MSLKLEDFFLKKTKTIESSPVPNTDIPFPVPPSRPKDGLSSQDTNLPYSKLPPYPDLGTVGLTLDDKVKIDLIKLKWEASEFDFPTRTIGGKQRKLNNNWLKNYNWMRYSVRKDSVYCVYCAIFGQNDSKCKTFGMKSPVSDWSNLGNLVRRHTHPESSHHTYVEMGVHFEDIMFSKQVSIKSFMSSSYEEDIRKNRHILGKIIEVILLCGRQNIPLRGHTEEKSNFMSILHTLAKDDPILSDHLAIENARTKYTSPQIQNELIELCALQISKALSGDCQKAKFFALLADETTDKSTATQLCVCIRYVHMDDPNGASVREQFLGFIHAKSTKGSEIFDLLVNFLGEHNINIANMRSQGYDGASNMSGRHNGVQALMKNLAPNAVYIHCKAHCLNLAIVHTCKEQCVRTMMATVQEIGFGFHYSAKRMEAFLEELANNLAVKEALDRKTKLTKLCETRWVSRADALTTLKNAFPVVVDSLEYLQSENDDKAGMHLNSILRYDFLISLMVCEHILSLVVHLSYYLQDSSCDMVLAIEECQVVLAQLRAERADVEVWNALYQETNQISRRYGIEPSVPRRVGRQQNRPNVPANTPSDYWRRSLYNVFLDHMITEIEDRLLKAEPQFIAFKLQPLKVRGLADNDISTIYRAFTTDITGDEDEFKREVARWKMRWSIAQDKPQNVLETLNRTDQALYPSIFNIIRILLTIPVLTASAERSFSVLRRIKTYLRTNTCQDRLTSLALLHVHRETSIIIEDVINAFTAAKNRKIAF